jgi:hypothetical protein
LEGSCFREEKDEVNIQSNGRMRQRSHGCAFKSPDKNLSLA